MNTHVTLTIAKLLKEKGFDVPTRGNIHCSHFHLCEKGIIPTNIIKGHKDLFAPIKDWNSAKYPDPNRKDGVLYGIYLSVPTISEVVMWLHETHEIWISVDIVITGSDEWEYCYSISYLPKEFENTKRRTPYLREEKSFKVGQGSYVGAWNTPTEAYSAAIEYCLTKLL